MIRSIDALIQSHEGLRLTAYWDPIGECWTCGYGCTGPQIGAGTVWTRDEAQAQFVLRRAIAVQAVITDLTDPFWRAIAAAPRGAVFVDIAYQCGGHGLAGFVRLIAAAKAADWPIAAAELESSRLARQTPRRIHENAQILLTDFWPV